MRGREKEREGESGRIRERKREKERERDDMFKRSRRASINYRCQFEMTNGVEVKQCLARKKNLKFEKGF